MDLQLDGKNVLVTGAGQGIGRRIGEAFAAEGANVAFHYHRSADGANEAVEQCRNAGVSACAVKADLSSADDLAAALDAVHESLGGVDVLVNNAAYTATGPFLEITDADIDQQVATVVAGTLRMTRAALPDLRERRGAVVSIAGDSGRVGESRAVVTSTCRASTYGFTKALAKEFGRDGVRANCVSLGLVRSPSVTNHFLGDATPEFMARLVKAYPLRRLGEMDDVVPAVLLLASPVAGWITGQVLSVNGGYAM